MAAINNILDRLTGLEGTSITHFNRLLREHVKWLNESRRRKPLNWKTANEYLKEFKQKAEEEIICRSHDLI